jgi:methylated-DNA-[protein]-cysteine S-methyltransferase
MRKGSLAQDKRPRFYSIQPSPIDDLLLIGDGDALTELYLPGEWTAGTLSADWVRQDNALLRRAADQLRSYFVGELTQFEVPLAPGGTSFQQQVWSALQQLPFGTTSSYGQLAASLGQPLAARAVGLANGRNPIPIIIPCHRLIGASGSLVGYGGGLERKRWLLDLEARVVSQRRLIAV